MSKRSSKVAPATERAPAPIKAAWPAERHSGEGAASALETLQKMEKRRDVGRPSETKVEEPD